MLIMLQIVNTAVWGLFQISGLHNFFRGVLSIHSSGHAVSGM